MSTSRTTPKSVDAYIARFPDEVQETLEKIRMAIKKAAPGVKESIGYQIPAFTLKGRRLMIRSNLFWFERPPKESLMRHLSLCMLLVVTALLGSTTDTAISAPKAAGEPPSSLVALCDAGERGEKLKFWGRVLDYDGRPLAKAAVVAYHTDHAGLYNPAGSTSRVPRLRGVAVTDEEGRFGFVTIRPAPYPGGSAPAHIHMSVTAPAHDVRYLEYWFRGDPLITESHREHAASSGSLVIVDLVRDAKNTWTFSHDIRLEGN